VDVRIFVLYASPESAQMAVRQFNNMLFCGRKMSGELYDQALFWAGRYQFDGK
jgi:hypothetical protein